MEGNCNWYCQHQYQYWFLSRSNINIDIVISEQYIHAIWNRPYFQTILDLDGHGLKRTVFHSKRPCSFDLVDDRLFFRKTVRFPSWRGKHHVSTLHVFFVTQENFVFFRIPLQHLWHPWKCELSWFRRNHGMTEIARAFQCEWSQSVKTRNVGSKNVVFSGPPEQPRNHENAWSFRISRSSTPKICCVETQKIYFLKALMFF